MKKIAILALLASTSVFNQSVIASNDVEQPYVYEFTIVKEHAATPVKDQAKTGTCWCHAMTSFMESELIHTHKVAPHR